MQSAGIRPYRYRRNTDAASDSAVGSLRYRGGVSCSCLSASGVPKIARVVLKKAQRRRISKPFAASSRIFLRDTIVVRSAELRGSG